MILGARGACYNARFLYSKKFTRGSRHTRCAEVTGTWCILKSLCDRAVQSDWERLCALVESVHTALEMTDIPYLKVRVTVCRAAGSSVPSRSIWELHCSAVQICASNLALELIRSHNLGWGKPMQDWHPFVPTQILDTKKKRGLATCTPGW
jgi:hypothetical protein